MSVVEGSRVVRETPVLSPQAELALLTRALYRAGYDDGSVGGHITYQQPDGTFLTLPEVLGWNEVRASDIIRIDHDGKTIEGIGTARPSIRLHLEFHHARPGCNVTVHYHPRFATIWSTTGRVPPAYDQRGALIPEDDIVLYDDYAGAVRFADPARAAVDAIGDANCALLRNHGVFVVGDSIPQTYIRAFNFEWRCRQAWFAEAIGATNTVPDDGGQVLVDLMASVGGVLPGIWEWAVRRELGPIEHVLS